ncbi:MAG: hypothetical protein FWE40_08770 [Oscillospiraceae bacterium]|nr:hypothetical protein [Oscillospiraceae bacterium]
MTKRIFAILLAMLALLSLFAVTVSAETANDAEPGLGGLVLEGNANMARVPNGIINRAARYDALAATASEEVQDEIFDIINPSETTTVTSQWELNRYLNAQNQAVANVLRANGYLGWFNAVGSWILGNFWWLWVPILAIPLLSAVGAFFSLL